jgi:hypothetical protein
MKYLVYLLISVCVTACGHNSKDVQGQQVFFSIPYFTECDAIISRASRYYDRRSKEHPDKGQVKISVEKFDSTFLVDLGVDGMLKVSAIGDLKLLKGATSLMYVTGIANTIAAVCLPDTDVSFEAPGITAIYNKLKKESRYPVIPIIKDGRVYLYKNSMSFNADHWD